MGTQITVTLPPVYASADTYEEAGRLFLEQMKRLGFEPVRPAVHGSGGPTPSSVPVVILGELPERQIVKRGQRKGKSEKVAETPPAATDNDPPAANDNDPPAANDNDPPAPEPEPAPAEDLPDYKAQRDALKSMLMQMNAKNPTVGESLRGYMTETFHTAKFSEVPNEGLAEFAWQARLAWADATGEEWAQ